MSNKIVLLTPLVGEELARLKAIYPDEVDVTVVQSADELKVIEVDDTTTLLSFGTGVIVPRDMLTHLARPAYNLHAATPDFPGRDPHHHAIYRDATIYGATLHVMTEKVDAGPIVAMETFSVRPEEAASDLLARANEAGMLLLERLGSRLLQSAPLPPLDGVAWGTEKTSRHDLVRLCSITPLICEEEFTKRYHAFDGGDHDNLALSIYGQAFRIDKKRPLLPSDKSSFEGFTEVAYRKMLRQLKADDYRFVQYGEICKVKHVLWRHDVDISMHRAVQLARIEAEEGVVATYFVNPHCSFYNLLEPEVVDLLDEIRELGHAIGLHFDADAYNIAQWTTKKLEQVIEREKLLLELIVEQPVRAMSWHNPDLSNLLDFEDDEICGVVNAYSASLKRDYVYCSDSNGYWRYQPMGEVIKQGHKRLHLLTHPAWWTPEPLAPSDRIDRALLGRARKIRQTYDELLRKGNRKNITK